MNFENLEILAEPSRGRATIFKGSCNNKRLPDFVFESIRKRAIADLDDAHRLAENAQ